MIRRYLTCVDMPQKASSSHSKEEEEDEKDDKEVEEGLRYTCWFSMQSHGSIRGAIQVRSTVTNPKTVNMRD